MVACSSSSNSSSSSSSSAARLGLCLCNHNTYNLKEREEGEQGQDSMLGHDTVECSSTGSGSGRKSDGSGTNGSSSTIRLGRALLSATTTSLT